MPTVKSYKSCVTYSSIAELAGFGEENVREILDDTLGKAHNGTLEWNRNIPLKERRNKNKKKDLESTALKRSGTLQSARY